MPGCQSNILNNDRHLIPRSGVNLVMIRPSRSNERSMVDGEGISLEILSRGGALSVEGQGHGGTLQSLAQGR